MYRVRAEAVSGKNVFANGKWLTCIGNKPVHVGDFIWTDGRCVYGNFKEAQQPLIITAPVEDEGIPIALESSPYLYTYKHKLKGIEEGIDITNAFRVPSGIDQGGIVSNDTFHNMINDYKGRAYKVPWRTYASEMNTRTHKIIASNITKSSDFYTIHVKVHENFQVAQIFKNEKLISTFDTQSYANREKNYVISTIRSLVSQTGGELNFDDLSTNPTYGHIKWGFIEDENNWALMFCTECSMTEGVSKYLGEGRRVLSPLSVHPHPIYQTGYVAARSETLYLITKNESESTIELSHIKASYGRLAPDEWMSPTGDDHWHDPWITHIEPEINLGDSHSIGSVPNATIPLQDGYWYKIIDSPTPNIPFYFNFPLAPVINISLFNPQETQIIEMKIYFSDYITIIKIGTGRYLLGVYSSFELFSSEEGWIDYYRDCIEPGLYICENKTLTKLKSGNCLNHRLRRMKKIKKWHKRLREISLEQDDTQ